jgi:hypothetical protein
MRLPLVVLAALARTAASYCCFYPETTRRCGNCQSIAEDSNYCAGSESKCVDECDHVWCDGAAADDGAAAAATPVLPDGPEWQLGTYTTRYWDCCKPSCAWNGKGDVDRPVLACEAETGEILTDANVAGVCDGGTAASCASNQPWTYNDGVSLGFAAASVGGNHGLNGDENCGQCYELVWSDEGGAHPDIVGKSHIIQVTNIGYDVTGDHSFDLQIPGGGQGIFDTGCVRQFPGGLFGGYSTDDFDCGVRYGGCADESGCSRLPSELRAGCEWRFGDSYRSDNPYVRFRRVRCPAELVEISGSTPRDDDDWPALDLDAYAGGGLYSRALGRRPGFALALFLGGLM